MAKAQAKEDRRLATKRTIEGVAEFESGDMVSEDEFDASPRLAFTSQAQPSSPQSRTNLFPASAENSDVEMCNHDGDFDQALPFKPPSDAKGSVTAERRSEPIFVTKKRRHDQTHSDAKPTSEPRAPSWASRAAAQMVMSRKSGPGRSGSGSAPPSLMHTSAPSVLTNNVKVISRVAPPLAGVQAEPNDTGVNSDAGLSDNDEMNGNEREAAEPVIRKPSKVGEPTELKKARNEELPAWLDGKWFRQTWDVPTKLAVETMQRIWDGSGGRDYEITAKHCRLSKGCPTPCRLVAKRHSDAERQGFANYHLADLRFAYKQSNLVDKKKWKGLFRNPLILQVFAAHLSAIDGSKEIPGFDKTPAYGALGLSVASVERALKLVATGTLTIDLVNAAKGKTMNLPKTMNVGSGKESTRQTLPSIAVSNKYSFS
ncbi:hypothetical protein EDB83DRAFT_2531429 [Lactarius deliciosus]|nr:hypothetical protein EDB83DRAFT_2531420 [Lactarius deliciosus]KAH9008928.1 hypothetical protein EDB83DRAFT_2531429 [Lactarius deliciosus]